MPDPLIDPQRVEEILKDCLFTDAELPENPTVDNLPDGAVVVPGVMNSFAFHPGRLASHRAEVKRMLGSLPKEFRKGAGGGWSLLNAVVDRDGELWTGLQKRAAELLALGAALDLAGFVLSDRTMWRALPGGLPYYWVADECFAEVPA